MDINFHYFAVKVLAIKAGFNEEDAQLIASYSQFVDDYDTYRYLYFNEIPVFAQHLALKIPAGWVFNPVTTGFNNTFDYSKVSLERYQKKILIPFHFITQEPISLLQKDRMKYRVKPVTMTENSLLQELLINASDIYITNPSRDGLIRIGILLHILADTYAHQRFSGYWNWENHTYLEDVVNNIDGKNITSTYLPNNCYYAPSIGHSNVYTAPDDSNVSFVMYQKKSSYSNYSDRYERDNTTEFITAAKEILNYLRTCLHKKSITDFNWDEIACRLRKGLLTAEKNMDQLIFHWEALFPDIKFYYNKNDMYTNNLKSLSEKEEYCNDETVLSIMNNQDYYPQNDILLESLNHDFFYYNVIADQIRRTVNPLYTKDIEFINYSIDMNQKAYTVSYMAKLTPF